MGPKDSYKIFFAIPFDEESRSTYYKYIVDALQKNYKERFVCFIANMQIGWSIKYDTIETFKMQNSELFKQFVKEIREADIIIADLTDNNPNVHVELGIALSYNKNILRVTRQSHEKLGFDVRNYEVQQYKQKEDLLRTIEDYLKLFLEIKNLDFEPENSKLYYHHPEKKALECWSNGDQKQEIIKARREGQLIRAVLPVENSKFHMRDGKVSVAFEITDQASDEDWFGVYLRAGGMGVLYGSILVYVRKNGCFEVITYPSTQILAEERLPGQCVGPKTLTIELEGDQISANIEETNLKCRDLDIQSPGVVKFASWFSNAEFWDAKIVCRDTIETFDRLSLVD
jgi:hypothetical protein